MQSDIKNTQ